MATDPARKAQARAADAWAAIILARRTGRARHVVPHPDPLERSISVTPALSLAALGCAPAGVRAPADAFAIRVCAPIAADTPTLSEEQES